MNHSLILLWYMDNKLFFISISLLIIELFLFLIIKNIKNKIITYKADITTKISTIAKNDRVYLLAGSSKARHGSRLITVLPYTGDFLDSCMLS